MRGGGIQEVQVSVDGISVFSGTIWFRSQIKFIEFAENRVPEGQLQWCIDIVRYL